MGALEPISRAPRRVLLRVAWPVALAGLSLLAGCMSVAAPKERLASLKVVAEPPDTVVYINGRFAGTARVLAKRPASRKPGVAYVTFSAPGYFPHDVRLDLEPGTTTVKMSLRPIPP